jgi:hypothetical protein
MVPAFPGATGPKRLSPESPQGSTNRSKRVGEHGRDTKMRLPRGRELSAFSRQRSAISQKKNRFRQSVMVGLADN